jgi:hypothetical protein
MSDVDRVNAQTVKQVPTRLLTEAAGRFFSIQPRQGLETRQLSRAFGA